MRLPEVEIGKDYAAEAYKNDKRPAHVHVLRIEKVCEKSYGGFYTTRKMVRRPIVQLVEGEYGRHEVGDELPVPALRLRCEWDAYVAAKLAAEEGAAQRTAEKEALIARCGVLSKRLGFRVEPHRAGEVVVPLDSLEAHANKRPQR